MRIPEIIITEDGTHSLFSVELNESYHSKFGAMSESRHVFIEAGFKKLPAKGSLNILEIGFGTGLNAWLTLMEGINKKIQIVYHTIEPFALPPSIYSLLNYSDFSVHESAKDFLMSMHEKNWNHEFAITDNFRLLKQNLKLEDTFLQHDFYDLVYFDAFSPEVQPELWTTAIFSKILFSMKVNGIFVTYSAKGAVRRNLKDAGFEAERIAGPIGKREMLRAFKSRESLP
jgi:tRNA U34 5-methylaminomethyl-2-thiouridine-forming methyltransferase MnmC